MLLLGALLTGLFSACTAKVDPRDPQQVAEGFWKAIIAENYEAAAELVAPEDRQSFWDDAVEGIKELPPFPEYPIFKADLDEDAQRGEAKILNWEFEDGVDMRKEDGRWWIVR